MTFYDRINKLLQYHVQKSKYITIHPQQLIVNDSNEVNLPTTIIMISVVSYGDPKEQKQI